MQDFLESLRAIFLTLKFAAFYGNRNVIAFFTKPRCRDLL
jgi:hypothetical protein